MALLPVYSFSIIFLKFTQPYSFWFFHRSFYSISSFPQNSYGILANNFSFNTIFFNISPRTLVSLSEVIKKSFPLLVKNPKHHCLIITTIPQKTLITSKELWQLRDNFVKIICVHCYFNLSPNRSFTKYSATSDIALQSITYQPIALACPLLVISHSQMSGAVPPNKAAAMLEEIAMPVKRMLVGNNSTRIVGTTPAYSPTMPAKINCDSPIANGDAPLVKFANNNGVASSIKTAPVARTFLRPMRSEIHAPRGIVINIASIL